MAVEKGNKEEEDKVASPGKQIHHSSLVYFSVAAFLAIFSDPCHVIFATLSPCVKCPVGGQAWIEKQCVMLHFVKNSVNSVTT